MGRLSEPADSSTVDVLLATTDHPGHGLFAIVERVINQILLARRIGAPAQRSARVEGGSDDVESLSVAVVV